MPTTPKDAELSPYMWGVLGYAAASRRPVYNVKGYLVQSVKALQRCGLVVVDPDGRIRKRTPGTPPWPRSASGQRGRRACWRA